MTGVETLVERGGELEVTSDAMYGGRLRLLQPRQGHRFTLESVLLADFALRQVRRTARIVDLGGGTGIIALSLLWRRPEALAISVDVEKRMALLSRRNAELNAMGRRLRVVVADVGLVPRLFRPGVAELVVFNPPFYECGRGEPSPKPERSRARHQIRATLADWVRAARHLVARRGALCLVYPATRVEKVLEALAAAGARPKTLRFVHPQAHAPATHVLVKAVANARIGLSVEEPLVVRDSSGEYSSEVKLILQPGIAGTGREGD